MRLILDKVNYEYLMKIRAFPRRNFSGRFLKILKKRSITYIERKYLISYMAHYIINILVKIVTF